MVVHGEGEKRGNWKLAKVEQLILGKDKEVRGAKVKVAGKGKPVYLKRPVQKLSRWKFKLDRAGKGRKRTPLQIRQRELCMICMSVRDELLQLFQKRRQVQNLMHRRA